MRDACGCIGFDGGVGVMIPDKMSNEARVR